MSQSAENQGFAQFDTPVGVCTIVWTPNGIAALRLPEASAEVSRAHIDKSFPGIEGKAPSPEAAAAIAAVQQLLRGEKTDLSTIRLDLTGVPELNRAVYDIARAIPPGETRSYGDIAKQIGNDPLLAQAVGQALGRNPVTIIVPCHRVLAAGGKVGGFSAFGSIHTKRKLLAIESVFKSEPDLFNRL
ncbi:MULTISPECIES: methylated-DNA--[protein]-cysteine S-methyltransferase [unclassified Beijerinckia]|uniref:methylated-DNA--[protein]-cysteine S-methyltransferase n=1 Tax=unclassified Beijerinckia TaxID=2638183 RepID=UPI00089A8190|nr:MULTISPECIES: methylated-DNA--[protein]-cysteine S-methyltransferase [unclassified Beijerinckia]MDH7796851.1 methylated-DNA-[protein]-cysteine S-methyltransferase [Beijerinckia sp. GAS462]SEC62402.1 methylated-DNA-[protein]-cysteine S-methyltransferase [Beijerinckia sp. 28-YEA-48]